jgi:hypothetical protein
MLANITLRLMSGFFLSNQRQPNLPSTFLTVLFSEKSSKKQFAVPTPYGGYLGDEDFLFIIVLIF